MTVPVSEWGMAVRGAARAVEAVMAAAGYSPVSSVGALAERFARSFEFSFYAMRGGADPEAAACVEGLIASLPDAPSDWNGAAERAARIFSRAMDLHGYAIRDDFDEFAAQVGRELGGWFAPASAPGPGLR